MVSRSVEAISTPVMKIIFRTMLRFSEVLHRSMPGSGRVGLAGGTRGEKPAERGPSAPAEQTQSGKRRGVAPDRTTELKRRVQLTAAKLWPNSRRSDGSRGRLTRLRTSRLNGRLPGPVREVLLLDSQ